MSIKAAAVLVSLAAGGGAYELVNEPPPVHHIISYSPVAEFHLYASDKAQPPDCMVVRGIDAELADGGWENFRRVCVCRGTDYGCAVEVRPTGGPGCKCVDTTKLGVKP